MVGNIIVSSHNLLLTPCSLKFVFCLDHYFKGCVFNNYLYYLTAFTYYTALTILSSPSFPIYCRSMDPQSISIYSNPTNYRVLVAPPIIVC